MPDIIWKDVVGYEGYYIISSTGLVMRVNRNQLKPGISRGYEHVILHTPSRVRNTNVHRLVAEAFIPNPHHKRTVNHKDGNKLNNNVENLEWATNQENLLHASKMGLLNLNRRILTESDIKEILELNKLGMSRVDIAKKLRAGHTTVRHILTGKSWSHITNIKK